MSTHQSSFIFLLVQLVLFHDAGKAAGIRGGARKVLSLGDGRRPATHCQTTHLGHSDRKSTCCTEFFWAKFASKSLINLNPKVKWKYLHGHSLPTHIEGFTITNNIMLEMCGENIKNSDDESNNSHLFFVAVNSGELWLEELSDLFSCDKWLLSRVFWVLGDTSRLQQQE